MNDIIIDFDIIDENENENIFDNLMSNIERLNLNGNANEDSIKKLEYAVLSIERKIQDLSDENIKTSELVYGQLKTVLSEYSKVLVYDNSVEMIGTTLEALNTIQFHLGDLSTLPKITNLLSISKNLNGNVSSVENIKKAAYVGLASLEYDNSNIFKLINEKFIDSWIIDMKFKTGEFKSHKPLEFIYQFVEILNNIEGVNIEIEKIEKGSIIASLRAFFTTEKSKRNAAEVLEGARKFAFGKLEKEFEEKEKIKCEKEKIDLEKRILQQEIEGNASLDSLYLAAINIKQAEEDLKRKKLENLKLSLEVLKESRDLFTDVLAEGFVSQSDFEILINEMPFLKKVDGKLTIGEKTLIKKIEEDN